LNLTSEDKVRKFITILIVTVFFCVGCAANVKQGPSPKQTWSQGDIDTYNAGIKDYDSGKFDAAVKELTASANDGYPQAQSKLGYMYSYGLGVDRDPTKGMDWLRKAADQGNADAQLEAGYLYETGNGVEQDYEKAFRWYTKAAEQGNARAENNLGAMHENGEWVALDYTKAFDWYRKAAKQRDALAIKNIADMYLRGIGFPEDPQKGIETYKLAAYFGSLDADLFLGKAYRDGLYGLKKDREMSDAYFEKVGSLRMGTWKQLENAFHAVIDAHKQYPKDAIKEKITGTTVVEFYYETSKPFDIAIKKSSGNDELDNAAFDAVKDSIFPLPPISGDKFHFLIPIQFGYGGPVVKND
jgi:TonB family protein